MPSFGSGGVVATLFNLTCLVDDATGVVLNVNQANKFACPAGGTRVVVPTAGRYVTRLEMAVDKDLPLLGRLVFHVRDSLDSKPSVHTCGFAGGEAISLFPDGYVAASIDVGCIPLSPAAVGKRRRLSQSSSGSSSGFRTAANPELVQAVVISEAVAAEQSPDRPVSASVVPTNVVQVREKEGVEAEAPRRRRRRCPLDLRPRPARCSRPLRYERERER